MMLCGRVCEYIVAATEYGGSILVCRFAVVKFGIISLSKSNEMNEIIGAFLGSALRDLKSFQHLSHCIH